MSLKKKLIIKYQLHLRIKNCVIITMQILTPNFCLLSGKNYYCHCSLFLYQTKHVPHISIRNH